MSEPPRLSKERKIGGAGIRSENHLAKRVGGRLRPASGALPGAKGDVDLPSFLMEAKSSTGDSLSLKREWLAKIGKEARSVGRVPALAVTFSYDDGRPIPDGAWVMVPEWLFKERLKEE